MSTIIMRILLAEYFVLVIACLYEKNWGRFVYWIGASLIQLAVLLRLK